MLGLEPDRTLARTNSEFRLASVLATAKYTFWVVNEDVNVMEAVLVQVKDAGSKVEGKKKFVSLQ
jgi:lipocalin